MPCSRCNGQVVKEHSYEMVDDGGTLRLSAWRWTSRCMQCGAVITDQVVETAPLLAAQSQSRVHPAEGPSPFMMF
ncbi:MAG: hypothetical protein GDA68_01660 [Nitrospira sp. CR2.1]|nr:hypothetical protein [Nitrospira sp. CR2.1]